MREAVMEFINKDGAGELESRILRTRYVPFQSDLISSSFQSQYYDMDEALFPEQEYFLSFIYKSPKFQ